MAVIAHSPAIGAVTGSIEAVRQVEHGSATQAVFKAIGGGFGGLAGAQLHRAETDRYGTPGSIAPGTVDIGGATLSADTVMHWYAELQSLAANAARNSQNADGLIVKAGYGLIEVLLYLLSGAVIGLPAGYISQLALAESLRRDAAQLKLPSPAT